jgi:hypothetical protein
MEKIRVNKFNFRNIKLGKDPSATQITTLFFIDDIKNKRAREEGINWVTLSEMFITSDIFVWEQTENMENLNSL